jgi:type VI secretion system protein ImpE
MSTRSGRGVDIKQLLISGQLTLAIERLNSEVKSHPTDTHMRTSLFELLCAAGDYQRAMRQLDSISQLESKAEVGVQVYRNALVAEQARSRLATDGLLPSFLTKPPRSALLRIEALNRLRERSAREARLLLEEAVEAEKAIPGTIDGLSFDDISDGDALLGPIVEAIINDRYVWLPFAQMKRIAVAKPKTMRDLIWIPASIEPVVGSVVNALIPVLYSGSAAHSDDQVRLGRATDWEDVGAGLMRGRGQRILFVDESERPVLQLGEIEFTSTQDSSA